MKKFQSGVFMDYGWVVNLFGLVLNLLKSIIEAILNMTLFKLTPALVQDFDQRSHLGKL